jgi:hypothetical protein
MHKTTWLCLVALASPVVASDLSLAFPMDCTLGQDCFIQNYVDRTPGDGFSDFACTRQTYDHHKGKDFALLSYDDMDRDVAVLAAAPGVVLGMRNTMRDRDFPAPNPEDYTGKECGNGLVIDHGDGWQTQYCHMKQGSLRVGSGAQVEAGQVLGYVGGSGATDFPHLHLAVRKDGEVIDPFDPEMDAECGAQSEALWEDDVPYAPGGLIATSIDVKVPVYEELKADQSRPQVWGTDVPALVTWTFGYGLRPGDTITLAMTGPQGTLFDETIEADKHRAQFFYAWGRRTPEGGWPKGIYQATARFERDGAELGDQQFDFTLE